MLCLADTIHNFKCVKIIQIWQNGCQLFLSSCWLMSRFIFNMFKSNMLIKMKKKHEYNQYLRFKG